MRTASAASRSSVIRSDARPLLSELRYEMISYSPEELIELAGPS